MFKQTMRASVLGALVASRFGCGSLLPTSVNDSPSPFQSFEAVRLALLKTVPNQTTLAELAEAGFNPQASANVTLVPYPEVLARLVPYAGIQPADLDPGTRACIAAQSACHAYVFRFGAEHKKREGGFWADFLNVKRVTNTTGWRFEGLVVVNDKVVLFRNFSGEERIDRTEVQNNPLGPFQPSGESAARAIIR